MSKPTVTLEWKLPISLVCSIIGLAVYATVGYNNIMEKLGESASQSQVRHWIDNAREKNPSLNWPSLPDRKESGKKMEPVAYFVRSEDKPTRD